MARVLLAAVLLALLAVLAYALNANIPALVSGVDQVANYPAFATARVVVLASLILHLSYAVASATLIVWRRTSAVMEALFQASTILGTVCILASIYVSFIDNLDLHPHWNEERLIANFAAYLLTFVVAALTRTSMRADRPGKSV